MIFRIVKYFCGIIWLWIKIWRVTSRKIPIIFEDNHLLVVTKPPNILSQGDYTGT